MAGAARIPGLHGLVPRIVDRRTPGPRISAVLRTRVIDQQLEDGLAAGCSQLVILGAGYDSRPYRIDDVAGAKVFEVDHPDTQAVKRRLLAAELRAMPANVVWVPVDFLRDDFGRCLVEAGYSTDVPTFFIWEGVTNYLNAEAVDGTLRWIAANSPAPAGSPSPMSTGACSTAPRSSQARRDGSRPSSGRASRSRSA